MSSAPSRPRSATLSSHDGLAWWQWLLFFLPGLAATGYTAIHFALYPPVRPVQSFQPLLTGPGLTGLVAAAILCLAGGIVLGFTTRPGRPVPAAIGWSLLSILTNLPVTVAGYSVLYLTVLR